MTDTHSTEQPVCQCGTCQAAFDEAMRQMSATLDSGKCLHWYIAVVMVNAKAVQALIDTYPDAATGALAFEDWMNQNYERLSETFGAVLDRHGADLQ